MALMTAFAHCGRLVGGGHLNRQRHLGQAVMRRGFDFELVEFEREISQAQVSDAIEHRTRIAIMDAHTGIAEALKSFRDAGVLTCALDWFGQPRPDIAFSVFPHGDTSGRLAGVVGADLITVGEAVRTAVAPPAPERTWDVVVCLGAGDTNGQTHSIAQSLADSGMKTAAVYGPYAILPSGQVRYELIDNPPQIVDVFCNARKLVVNGGTCMFEAAVLGIDFISVPQSDAERTIAEWFAGTVVDGAHSQDASSGQRLRLALESEYTRSRFTVDGNGAQRIAEVIDRELRRSGNAL